VYLGDDLASRPPDVSRNSGKDQGTLACLQLDSLVQPIFWHVWNFFRVEEFCRQTTKGWCRKMPVWYPLPSSQQQKDGTKYLLPLLLGKERIMQQLVKEKTAKEEKKRITYEHLPNAFAGEEK